MSPGEFWSMVGVISGIVSAVIVAGVAYLRLFVRNELTEFTTKTVAQIEAKFITKELTTAGFQSLEKRIERLESGENVVVRRRRS